MKKKWKKSSYLYDFFVIGIILCDYAFTYYFYSVYYDISHRCYSDITHFTNKVQSWWLRISNHAKKRLIKCIE